MYAISVNKKLKWILSQNCGFKKCYQTKVLPLQKKTLQSKSQELTIVDFGIGISFLHHYADFEYEC